MNPASECFLDYALKYTALGWHVFPLLPGQKVPATKHGFKDAVIDEKQIKAWWSRNPRYNIGVACGEISGVYVIDVDVPESGTGNGYEDLKEFPPLPLTMRQDTPRGGFHAFFKASNPPASRNKFRPNIDIRSNGFYVVMSPSIHPNGGKYKWGEGYSPDEIELAEFPNALRPSVRAPWADDRNYNVQVPAVSPASPAEMAKTLKRASMYLEMCDPAVQGCGGHNKLLWAAVTLVQGFWLSDSQAYDLLAREYNPRCVPPWDLSDRKDEKDFRRKISEARKVPSGRPPGWLLHDDSYTTVADIPCDVEKLIRDWASPTTDSFCSGRLEAPINKEEHDFLIAPTGLLGEICSWINSTAIRPQPFLTLGCVLAFCGTLFGRKIRDEQNLRTNLYCMGIGQSSCGKAHAPGKIRELCEEAGCGDLIGGDDWASTVSIESRLERFPATLYLLDEIGYIFSAMKSGKTPYYLSGIVPLLMKLYSAAAYTFRGKEYAEEEKQRMLIQPCCSIFGYSTPERYGAGLTPNELQDGWLSRCLVFRTTTMPPKKRGLTSITPPISIVEQTKEWFARIIEPASGSDLSKFVKYAGGAASAPAPEQIVVATTAEANKLFCAFDRETEKLAISDRLFACLWAKSEENARKIALILAGSESFGNPVITETIASYSCRLMRYLLQDFSETIAPTIVENELDSRKQKIKTVIDAAGIGGLVKRDLTRKTQWTDSRNRAAMIADLIEAEEIVCQKKGSRIAFWTPHNFRLFSEGKTDE